MIGQTISHYKVIDKIGQGELRTRVSMFAFTVE